MRSNPASKKKRGVSLLSYLLSIIATIIGFLLNFILARVLRADNYGKLQLIVSLFSTISSILIFGISSFVVREAGTSDNKKQLMSNCYSLYFTISLLLFASAYSRVNQFLFIAFSNYLFCFNKLIFNRK